jgi:hypothetical protein
MHLKQQQKRIPNVHLFFFLMEETIVHFRLQPKHVGKTSGYLEEGDSCRRLSLWLNRKLGQENRNFYLQY